MVDPRFFALAGPLTLRRLAEITDAEIRGPVDGDTRFIGVAPLSLAGPEQVSFLDNRKYVDEFAASKAGACLVHPDLAARAPEAMGLLVTPEPYRGYARVVAAFHPPRRPEPGIHATAVVDPAATIGAGTVIEAGAVIGAGAELGRRCHVKANATLDEGVVLGNDCIGPSVSLACCIVGDRVIIHAGARIGQDGFGFALGPGGHLKVPQVGRVLIEDDVEIGANTTIDRGAAPDTVIGAGTKIDNLVQIAHNVRLGRGCVIVSQVGISGSTEVGDFAMMGGQAGLTGHLKIGAGARIGAQSGIMRDVEPGSTVAGSPAAPAKEHWRQIAFLHGIGKKKK